MGSDLADDIATKERHLRIAAIAFAAGSGLHVVDHLRRGQGSVTETLFVLGNAALVLQVVTIVAGFVLVTPLGVVGVIFALAWAGLLLMRRDVARKMARGELPSQRGG